MPELITGTKGTPHVTSTQDRSIYEKIIGKGSYILDDNELLEPELQSNQSLRIRSGMLYHHGSITEVKRNTYDEVTIANGSQGMKRIDLVVLRYTKNPETEIEEMNWVVIQGTPAASDPVAPAYTEGNMQEGDLTDDCPFCEVHLDGIQVTEVVKLMKVLDGSLESLNSKRTTIYDTPVSGKPTSYTLLESANNYDALEIHIRNNNDYGGVFVAKPSESSSQYPRSFVLSMFPPSGKSGSDAAIWCQTSRFQLSTDGMQLNNVRSVQVRIGSIESRDNVVSLFVEKVVGIRY